MISNLIHRLVQLDKLRLATVHAEEDASLARGGKDPFIVVKAPSASKGGVAETSIKVMYFSLVGWYYGYTVPFRITTASVAYDMLEI